MLLERKGPIVGPRAHSASRPLNLVAARMDRTDDRTFAYCRAVPHFIETVRADATSADVALSTQVNARAPDEQPRGLKSASGFFDSSGQHNAWLGSFAALDERAA